MPDNTHRTTFLVDFLFNMPGLYIRSITRASTLAIVGRKCGHHVPIHEGLVRKQEHKLVLFMLCKGNFRRPFERFKSQEDARIGLTENISYLMRCVMQEFKASGRNEGSGPTYLFWLRVYCCFTQRFSVHNIDFGEVYTLAAFVVLMVAVRMSHHFMRNDKKFGPWVGAGPVVNQLAVLFTDVFILDLYLAEEELGEGHPRLEPQSSRKPTFGFREKFNLDFSNVDVIGERQSRLSIAWDLAKSTNERVAVPSYSGWDTLLSRQVEVVDELYKSRIQYEEGLQELHDRVITQWRTHWLAPAPGPWSQLSN